MVLLIIGVLLWIFAHLFPSLMPGARTTLIAKLGENPYKGLFTLDLVIAIVLMVLGWRSATIELWYAPPLAGSPLLVAVLVLVAFVLMGAANAPTNIKRFLRHPMLAGVIVWGIGHLLANGDNRSTVLFGGLSIWAAVAIFTINRREGEWTKPDAVPVAKDIVLVAIGFVLFAVVTYFHDYLSGVTVFPGG